MRIIFIIALILLCAPVSAQTHYEWVKPIRFTHLEYPGQKHLFYQFCIPEDDSLVTNGSLTFSKAIFPEIGICSFTQMVEDTIYTGCRFETNSKEATANLKTFFEKEVGKNYLTQNFEKIEIYSWILKLSDRTLIFVLTIKKGGKKAQLTINSTVFIPLE